MGQRIENSRPSQIPFSDASKAEGVCLETAAVLKHRGKICHISKIVAYPLIPARQA
jgi:hypothetical protein